MIKYLTGIVAAFALVANLHAQELELRDNVPDSHTVVKGDTLWGISDKFLKNPWLWPEIWHVNTQIENPHLIYPGDVIRLIYLDGKPRLTLDSSGRIFKLEPKAHVVSVGEAIDAIPLDQINSFLSRSRVVDITELKLSPYVVSGIDEHLITGAGDQAYVRGEVDAPPAVYGVYRQGEIFKDPVTKEVLGVQALDIGTVQVRSQSENVAKVDVMRTTEEMRIGDRLLKEEQRAVDSTFYPSSPADQVEGQIIAVEDGVTQVGRLSVVVLNRGTRESLQAGDVLAVYKAGNAIKDRISGDKIQLPDERAGLLMVFRTFEKVSMALVLEADQGLAVFDKVRNP